MSEPVVHPENFRYAGFFMRLLAHMVDLVIVIVLLIVMMFTMFFANLVTLTIAGPLYTPTALLVDIAIAVLVIVLWTSFGATPGKLAINAVIVDRQTGRLPTAMQSTIRYVGYIVSTIPLLLGFFWIIWDERKQGFHDKLADTVVVYKS